MPTINITDKDAELLKAVVEVMKAEIDWEKVADKAGMKTSKYARDRWTIVRTKLIGGEGEGRVAASKKRKDSATSTPAPVSKKAKTIKSNGDKTPLASDGDEDDGAEVSVKDEVTEDGDGYIFD